MQDYRKIAALLEKKLSGSAFRRGTSAHRLGLIQDGISDHLPINILAGTTSIISWNMLAEAHLYNNFMNISGSKQLFATLSPDNIYGGSENSNKLYYYFSELGQFLYDKRTDDVITFDKILLDQFNSLPKYVSKLALSRDPETAAKKLKLMTESRAAIAAILMNSDHDDAHEFQLAIQHSVDLIYHIKHDHGALKWSNRFNQLKENRPLIDTLYRADFLCFQECTSPLDIQSLLPNKESLVHRINNTTNDHCVILYDKEKFKLIKSIRCTLDQGKKPFIIARFENIETGKQLIVGSVHHPGGKENHLHDIIKEMNELKDSPNEEIEFYIPGDYNHVQDFFKIDPQFNYDLLYPTLGTMAGSDYGNMNESIDVLLTNVSADTIHVERVNNLQISRPVEMPLRVHFKDEDTYRSSASPSFDVPVQREISIDEAENAVDILGQNEATYAMRLAF